ncbi:MAG: hypothetical protein JWL81_3493 [Verrucomicrobiales bacterium]|nr:hypothetical protein [Verrucomicrobiales bacterium]
MPMFGINRSKDRTLFERSLKPATCRAWTAPAFGFQPSGVLTKANLMLEPRSSLPRIILIASE